MRRRAAGRQPEQDRLADHLVAVAPHLSGDTEVVPRATRGAGDRDQGPIGRSHVRKERAPVECVEPSATPPPPGERKGDTKWYDITAKLEEIMKREKGLLPNVDAYSASTYYMMGIPLDLYTPIFAISRISGWTAHILEQYADNKLIRPRAEYVGPRNVTYVPIDER